MGLTYAYRYKAVEPKVRKNDTSRKETSRKAMDRSEWIEVPNATLAIINGDTFQLVQNQLERNRHKTPHNKKHSYLFNNGRLRCGVCGRSMVASARERKGGYYNSYRCISNTKPDYKKNAPTRWMNGFGIVEMINSNGFFNLYTVIINKGTFIYNGKVYTGEV